MNRRNFLKVAVGTGVVAGALGSVMWVWDDENGDEKSPGTNDQTDPGVQTDGDPANRSRLEEWELRQRDEVCSIEPGELIDPYLSECLTDGTRLLVPGGRYRWNGGGFGRLSNAALVGLDDVVLEVEDGASVNENVVAENGTVHIKNVTQVGAMDGSKDSRIAAWAKRGATLILESFDRPDGQVGNGKGGTPTGFFTPPEHGGTVVYRNCHVEGFGNNGIYASPPQKGKKGRVVVEGGLYRNNNVADVRVGSDGSVVRNVTIVHEGDLPTGPKGGTNGRGLWVRHGGENVTIENCDITVHGSTNGGTIPLALEPRNDRGSGTVRRTRIWNDLRRTPIQVDEDVAGAWSGSGIHLTGGGDLSPDAAAKGWIACAGADCRRPTRDRQWVGRDGSSE